MAVARESVSSVGDLKERSLVLSDILGAASQHDSKLSTSGGCFKQHSPSPCHQFRPCSWPELGYFPNPKSVSCLASQLLLWGLSVER